MLHSRATAPLLDGYLLRLAQLVQTRPGPATGPVVGRHVGCLRISRRDQARSPYSNYRQADWLFRFCFARPPLRGGGFRAQTGGWRPGRGFRDGSWCWRRLGLSGWCGIGFCGVLWRLGRSVRLGWDRGVWRGPVRAASCVSAGCCICREIPCLPRRAGLRWGIVSA